MIKPIYEPKIRWQCRRGMLELDILLIPFFDNYYKNLSPKDKRSFNQLLTFADPVLYDWLMGKEIAPIPFINIINHIINYHQTRPFAQ
ncbi:MAG: Tetratricopeptide repeat family protein [Francisellaceae bacterium]|nr:Tetratricopeptide repeat family protein [Francisellaceae bacterium]